jgi:hypothetical protein
MSLTRSKVVRVTSPVCSCARSATAHAIDSVVTAPVTSRLVPVTIVVR